MTDTALEEIAELYETSGPDYSGKVKRAGVRNMKRSQQRGYEKAHTVFAIARAAVARRKSKAPITLAGQS